MDPEISGLHSHPENPEAEFKTAALPSLRTRIEQLRPEIESLCRSKGLDFFPVLFEPLDAEKLSIVAARGGFPRRMPHWSYGQDFNDLWKRYDYGASRIYELVINNDPSVAYLLCSNAEVEQKLVMAHVYGHVDFFKHNLYFANTNRQMLDKMGDHAARVREYEDLHGKEAVAKWIDLCKSIDNLIGTHPQAIGSVELLSEALRKSGGTLPPEPTRDIVRFLIKYAPIEEWQRDILTMIRDEAYYFQPQAQTKIMNEGWATYWHSKLMEQELLVPRELVNYCCTHSGALVMLPGRLNPYKIGVELWRDIEQRWDRGLFGPEYENCTDIATKRAWDKRLGLGQKKIFEVRATHNDVTFIDEFFTFEFASRQGWVPTENEEKQRMSLAEQYGVFLEFKEKLLDSLRNRGQPVVTLEDANYHHAQELYFKHHDSGQELERSWAQKTIENLYKIWGSPINIETIKKEKNGESKKILLAYDGDDHMERSA